MANLRPFIIALAFGLIAVVLVYLYIQKVQSQGPAEVQMARVVRAVVDIPPRTTIREHMVEEIDVLADNVTPDTVTELEEILGQVSVTTIYEHQILMTQMFKEETALADISRVLQEGERAITVGITEVSGLGGNLRPGDNVDVLVTILSNEEVGVASTFTVLRDIDVMAVGQDIGFEQDETTGGTQVSKSVTLRVNPDQAEILTLATEVGSIRLSLRHPDDPFAPATNGTSLTEFTKYTPTRADLEEMAAQQRALEEAAAARASAATPVYIQQPSGNGETTPVYIPLPETGPPPILVELILGGQSQMVQLEAEERK
jgi:pilus assembly protein CpaB